MMMSNIERQHLAFRATILFPFVLYLTLNIEENRYFKLRGNGVGGRGRNLLIMEGSVVEWRIYKLWNEVLMLPYFTCCVDHVLPKLLHTSHYSFFSFLCLFSFFCFSFCFPFSFV
ncbi:hypothetical protein OWV82_003831 [Melia azedarach]|uniref:Uncharacterized protein n=1 Tax=Melia azedarach TaxID=155640 RepID=A0ACC1YM79_MELAZ|nr:hypothetical protein OWV82_003831 [Melia azedarach]